MKRYYFIIFVYSVSVFFQNALFAQTSSANASAILGISLGIKSTPGELNFGKLSCSDQSGTCVVSTKHQVTTTGGVTFSGGKSSAAIFTISGKYGSIYNITFSANQVTLTHIDGSHSMIVDNFKTETRSKGLNPGGVIDVTTGEDELIVGGTLNTQSNQLEGSYNGTFTIIVNYN